MANPKPFGVTPSFKVLDGLDSSAIMVGARIMPISKLSLLISSVTLLVRTCSIGFVTQRSRPRSGCRLRGGAQRETCRDQRGEDRQRRALATSRGSRRYHMLLEYRCSL